MNKLHFDGPVVLVIMDGIGLASPGRGNAVSNANTPFISKIMDYPHLALGASGEYVGLLPGVMGNSEVGHNTIGCGQIIKQGIAEIQEEFNSGKVWQSETWQQITIQATGNNNTLHFAGIFSDGRVHSDINHLEAMIKKAYEDGVRRMRVHCMFDGRDVPPQSEPKYIERFENFVKQFADADIKIASGGGRMTTTCDRYENDWGMVERGFNMIVHGLSDYHFHSAKEAIEHFRAEDPEIQDQYLPSFVIDDENGKPVGAVKKGDVVLYFDYRADRAIEIATAFTAKDFTKFDRGNDFFPSEIYFAGLTEYDADKHIPAHQLVAPNRITNPLNEFLNAKKITELAVSETVKFGHVTYYFNGDSYDETPLEKSIEIPSDQGDYNLRPWMKSAEITDAVLENLDKYKFIRLNYPNGDMVGHYGELDSTTIAVDTVDLALARLAKKVDELGGCMLITADHGNAEELIDENGQPKTSHTTNPVPFIIYDNTSNKDKYELVNIADPGLANIAATIATLLGFDDYPESWHTPLIVVK